MYFFDNQDAARRQTRRLILLFVLAVLAIAAVCDLAVVAVVYGTVHWNGNYTGNFTFPLIGHAIIGSVVLAVIVFGTLKETFGMAAGGPAVALDLGARRLSPDTTDPAERRLINVIEEMAIASGTMVPQVFVMDGQSGINAFAAGFSPNEAAIAVTRGALDALNRAELQGVIGHEFSHILNGDMRLNMRLMGVLGGLLMVSILGKKLAEASTGGSKKDSGEPFWPLTALGVALLSLGYFGVFLGRIIKSGVTRQREFLADASSVQFTRNPDGIGGALARIAQSAEGAIVTHPHTEKASHMFFGAAINTNFSLLGKQGAAKLPFSGKPINDQIADLLASHPPVDERLLKIYGRRISPRDIVAHAEPSAAAPRSEMADNVVGLVNLGRDSGIQRAPDSAAKGAVTTHAAAITRAVGTVSTAHMDYAVLLLDALPLEVRKQLRTARGAMNAMYGLVLALGGPVKMAQAQILSAAGADADAAFTAAARLQGLDQTTRMPAIALAIPALKSLPEQERLQFLVVLRQLIEADHRVTLQEFVLGTLLAAALGAGAGRAVPIKYRSIEPIAEDARLVLSLFAHASGSDSAKAFGQGVRELGLASTPALIEVLGLNIGSVTDALGRLNQLAPLQKPRLVNALTQSALADGKLVLAEAELLRAICAAIDCPLPPFMEDRFQVATQAMVNPPSTTNTPPGA